MHYCLMCGRDHTRLASLGVTLLTPDTRLPHLTVCTRCVDAGAWGALPLGPSLLATDLHVALYGAYRRGNTDTGPYVTFCVDRAFYALTLERTALTPARAA
jgi:hypothetical protein